MKSYRREELLDIDKEKFITASGWFTTEREAEWEVIYKDKEKTESWTASDKEVLATRSNIVERMKESLVKWANGTLEENKKKTSQIWQRDWAELGDIGCRMLWSCEVESYGLVCVG